MTLFLQDLRDEDWGEPEPCGICGAPEDKCADTEHCEQVEEDEPHHLAMMDFYGMSPEEVYASQRRDRGDSMELF